MKKNILKATFLFIGLYLIGANDARAQLYQSSQSPFENLTTKSNSSHIDWKKIGIGLDDPHIIRKLQIRKGGFSDVYDPNSPYIDNSMGIRMDFGILNQGTGTSNYISWDMAINGGSYNIYNVNNDRVDFSINSINGFTGIGTENAKGRLDVNSGHLNFDDALFVGANHLQSHMGGIIHHQYSNYAWQEVAQNTADLDNSSLRFHFTNRSNVGELIRPDVLTIHSLGRVGINTANPTSALEVKGAVKINQGTINTWTDAHWSERIYMPIGGAIVTDAPSNVSQRHLGFGMTNEGWYFITGDDQLGQDNNPVKYAAVLETDGKFTTREVVVSLVDHGAWPDYVFNEDYKLKSLQEVEKYIEINGHLPEVPSADKISEDGINLGEMNALLLKKLEELTLHVIQQSKEIEKLKTQH
ncbi:MAG: hypothetical protein RIE58_00995 [Vicingaceae bacterium]